MRRRVERSRGCELYRCRFREFFRDSPFGPALFLVNTHLCLCSRRTRNNPFLRTSATESSIFGPFVAAINSCSRLLRRRSLSWRINSRTYSLGVPQSPVATWVSTYCFRASGREIFRDVIAITFIL